MQVDSTTPLQSDSKMVLILTKLLAVIVATLAFIVPCSSQTPGKPCSGLPICYCNHDNTVVNCRFQNLTSVPSNIPRNAKQINLSNNFIVEIAAHTFSPLENLTKLFLNDNAIMSIASNAFNKLSQLRSLLVANNSLGKVSKDMFSGLNNLQEMHLSSNQIQTVDDNAFDELVGLKRLNLSDNALSIIPAIGHKPKLYRLDLSRNKIQNPKLPISFQDSCFYNGTSRGSIILRENNIESLSMITDQALLGDTSSFLEIDFSNNTMCNGIATCIVSRNKGKTVIKLMKKKMSSGLKPLIANLTAVAMDTLLLNVAEPFVDSINGTFYPMFNISIDVLHVDYRWGGVTYLPQNAFVGLNKLRTLSLKFNKINVIESNAFHGLDNLKELSLYHNKLTNISMVSFPTTLIKLNLKHNLISFSDGMFRNYNQLKVLDLSNNPQLVVLRMRLFDGLYNLKSLSLKDCNIKLHQGMSGYLNLHPLVKLTTLILAKNNIQWIDLRSFINMTTLRYLDMSDNGLSDVAPKSFKYLTSLQILHLERNELGNIVANASSDIFFGLQNLMELHLTTNNIKSLHHSSFQYLRSLRMLKLDNNGIANLDGKAFLPTVTLSRLDFSYNSINNIKAVESFPTTLQWVNMTGNKLKCDCDLLLFRDWVSRNNTLFPNYESYKCTSPEKWRGQVISSFNKTQLECMLIGWWPLMVGLAIGAVLVFTIACILYKKRWWIRLHGYKITRKRKRRRGRNRDPRLMDHMDDQDEGGPTFDAYISCAEADHGWVEKHLLPGIDKDVEGDGRFQLYYDKRDGDPSHCTIGNISENLSASRKVIVVLSSNYMNPMHKFELDLFTNQMYEGAIEEIIIVHIQQGLPRTMIPKHLAHTMKRNKVLEWADNENARTLVKQKIVEALKDNRVAADMDVD